MAVQSLSFQGVTTAEQVNKITTALMMLDGVDSAEVGALWCRSGGGARNETLSSRPLKKLNLRIKVS
ncbi:hypothetical protein DK37_17380 [Halomonas sp. SUBG004]|nr:hypothetical protein DK37_17380 [Halomonas sp. SUBG004]